jgi:hypothetical protein
VGDSETQPFLRNLEKRPILTRADRRVVHRHTISGTLQSVPESHTLSENPGLAGGLGRIA